MNAKTRKGEEGERKGGKEEETWREIKREKTKIVVRERRQRRIIKKKKIYAFEI